MVLLIIRLKHTPGETPDLKKQAEPFMWQDNQDIYIQVILKQYGLHINWRLWEAPELNISTEIYL